MTDHRPIHIESLELSLPHKLCFRDFTTRILHGSRIAVMGRNGSGKSGLLKILMGTLAPSGGRINAPEDVVTGYVPQVVEAFDELSGGQRLNQALSAALRVQPNLLLLDEPTNHLDRRNRRSLLRMLHNYAGTLIVVSHDTELLRESVDTLWHIDDGRIEIFTGSYDDYTRQRQQARASTQQALDELNRQKKDVHERLMQEQTRAAKSRAKGEKSIEQRKWPTVVSKAKALRAQETTGRKKAAIDQRRQDLVDSLAKLRLPEIITPRFSLPAAQGSDRTLVQVNEGAVAYVAGRPVLTRIHLSLGARDRIALCGDNASGKSTLVKAILDEAAVLRTGDWQAPARADIGYLDQHYGTLPAHDTVFDTIATLMPGQSHAEVRRHLNDFLFRKNEEVNALVCRLSGGEKARLSLACIAARTPRLLVLDEITNNLDLETRRHVSEVLKAYPGAMIVISHDDDFLEEIGVGERYEARRGELVRQRCG